MSLVNRSQQPQKRFRGRSLDLQLQEAVRDAQKLMTAGTDDASISRMKLAQTRITSLQRLLNRRESAKLKKALLEIGRLTAEVSRLKQELAAKPGARPLTEVELALAQYEKEKGGTHVG
jgi:hypothetical protein